MTAPREQLGVAVVGLGVGFQHAKAYLATGHCRLIQLYDRDHHRSRAVAEELPGRETVPRYLPSRSRNGRRPRACSCSGVGVFPRMVRGPRSTVVGAT